MAPHLANHSPELINYGRGGPGEGVECGGPLGRGQAGESMPLLEGLIASQDALHMPPTEQFVGRRLEHAHSDRLACSDILRNKSCKVTAYAFPLWKYENGLTNKLSTSSGIACKLTLHRIPFIPSSTLLKTFCKLGATCGFPLSFALPTKASGWKHNADFSDTGQNVGRHSVTFKGSA